jgi:hypothetical protein
MNPKSSWKHLSLACIGLLAACSLLPTPTPTPQVAEIPTAGVTPVEPFQPSSPTPEATVQIYLPEVAKPTEVYPAPVGVSPTEQVQPTPPLAPSISGRLAFLQNGDLILADLPGPVLHQLTSGAGLLNFAWSPDGSRLATFNGHQLCFLDSAGAPLGDCLDLGLTDEQAPIPRGIVWSPDESTIVLWNQANPWDEGALGWLIVPLNATQVPAGPGQEILRIADPVDWGLAVAPNNDPGGITGQPLFLPDGRLVGTLSHRWLCGSGGCHYQLYEFNPAQRSFSPYPNNPGEGWSEGQGLVLSTDGRSLADFGAFFNGCDSFVTFVDVFDLASSTRQAFNLDMEVVGGLDLSPEGQRAVIARLAGCASPPEQVTWDRSCGLSQGFDILPMQVWDLSSDQRSDLLPGTAVDWSPAGDWITFRSCLAQDSTGAWQPASSGPPSVYVLDLASRTVIPIGAGASPAWSPR